MFTGSIDDILGGFAETDGCLHLLGDHQQRFLLQQNRKENNDKETNMAMIVLIVLLGLGGRSAR